MLGQVDELVLPAAAPPGRHLAGGVHDQAGVGAESYGPAAPEEVLAPHAEEVAGRLVEVQHLQAAVRGAQQEGADDRLGQASTVGLAHRHGVAQAGASLAYAEREGAARRAR
jgi:hypothetical protein